MMIECAKSTKPIGVRGRGNARFVFCPNRKGGWEKYESSKELYEKCLKCDHYGGEHKAMGVDLAYTNPHGDEERLGEKKIVLTEAEGESQKEKEVKWLQEELERMAKESKQK